MKRFFALALVLLLATPVFADVVEDSAHITGTKGPMCLAVRNDTPSTLTSTDGDYSAIAVDAYGRPLIGAIVPGVAATSLGKAEDATHASGDTGIAVLTRRIDTPATSASNSGDYATLDSDANGATWVHPTGKTTKVCVAITPDTGAYQAADIVGGKLTFAALFQAPNYSGVITDVAITNTEIDGISWDLCVFSADPATSTVADQGALTVTAADAQKIKCLAISDGRSFAASELYQAQGFALGMTSTSGTIYAVLRTNGAPTWAAAQTVNLCLTAIND